MVDSKNIIIERYLSYFITDKKKIKSYFSSSDLDFIYQNLNHTNEKITKFDNNETGYRKSSNEKHQTPFLDEFVLSKIDRTKRIKIWPNNATFAVHLTHDFDRFTLYSPQTQIRRELKKLIFKDWRTKSISILRIIKDFFKNIFYNKIDPLWHYEDWFKLEKKYNTKSTCFFYMHPKLLNCSVEDCDYKIGDYIIYNNKKMTIHECIKQIHKIGNEIGIHGSFKTYRSTELLKIQKSQIENIINSKVKCSRQHYLHFKWNDTVETHIENELNTDSTLGFNFGFGFRSGTSFPYLIKGKGNKFILEIPLIIMDSSLRKYCENDFNKMYRTSIEIINKIEKVGGCLTLNFHPCYINTNLFKLYEMLLEYLSKKNCVFLSANEIYEICVE